MMLDSSFVIEQSGNYANSLRPVPLVFQRLIATVPKPKDELSVEESNCVKRACASHVLYLSAIIRQC